MDEITKYCCGCSACKNICPTNAIDMDIVNGFYKPIINHEKCIDCGLCKEKCPQNNTINVNPIDFYLCESKKREEILSSTSGAIFQLLSSEIIRQKGVVFGVEIDEECNVFHSYTDNLQGINKYKGSKYVQSNLGNAFSETELFLKKGTVVLFSGTPCQIAGLSVFLGRDYENLYTVDFLCHGVPSINLLKQEVLWLEKKYSTTIKHLSFRSKDRFGTPQYAMTFKKNKNKTISLDCSMDPYLNAYISSNSLNESCYSCKYANYSKYSSITIADSWEGESNQEGFKSIAIINNEKGKKLFDLISQNLEKKQVEPKTLEKHKLNLTEPVKITNKDIYEKLRDAENYFDYANNFCRTKKYFIHKLFNFLPDSIKRIIRRFRHKSK